MRVRDLKSERRAQATTRTAEGTSPELFRTVRDCHFKILVASSSFRPDANPDLAPIKIRIDLHLAHVARRHRLQPHSLPYPRNLGVVDPARSANLLAPWLLPIVGRITDCDDELLFRCVRFQLIGDVERERLV